LQNNIAYNCKLIMFVLKKYKDDAIEEVVRAQSLSSD